MHRHRSRGPSPWITRHAGLIAAGGRALDLACGGGRHTRYLRDRGLRVTAIDIDISGVCDLADDPLVEIVEMDLERPGTTPLAGRRFDAVVVTDYLFRPLLVPLVDCLEPGGGLPLRDLRPRQRALRPPPQPGLTYCSVASCWRWPKAGSRSSPTSTARCRRPRRRSYNASVPGSLRGKGGKWARTRSGPERAAARRAHGA